MKKLITALALGSQLILQDPSFAESKTLELSNNTKGDIVSVFDEETPNFLCNIMPIELEYQSEIDTELRQGKDGFVGAIKYISNNKVNKRFFFNEILEIMKRKDFPLDKLEQELTQKFGETIYQDISSYFFYVAMFLGLENPNYNIFSYENKEDFYDLDSKTISSLDSIGLSFFSDIENYDNFSFQKIEGKDAIAMVTYQDGKIKQIGELTAQQLKNINKSVLDSISYLMTIIKKS